MDNRQPIRKIYFLPGFMADFENWVNFDSPFLSLKIQVVRANTNNNQRSQLTSLGNCKNKCNYLNSPQ